MNVVVNNKELIIRRLVDWDFADLFKYLQKLSPETKSRFGPHLFDIRSIENFYSDFTNRAYLAIDSQQGEIVAYSIVKAGIIEYDAERFRAYGIISDETTDYTFAPSVADDWQSCGIGSLMFGFILDELEQAGVKRLFLWGGVQAGNERAVNYYKKFGFRTLGYFFHHVDNYDMVLDLK